MEELLQGLGLTPAQAEAYLYLLDHPQTTPPRLAKQLGITRTNAYKLLDRLVELELATRRDIDKKLAYSAEDPIALTNLLSVERNRMIALERGVKESLHGLRNKFRQQTAKTTTKVQYGRAHLVEAYQEQAAQGQDVYFVASRSDIPYMGFETMSEIRHMPKKYGAQRYGLVVDHVGGPVNPAIDERTNLTRTWLPAEEYDAPVEWAVSGDEVNIYVFEKQGSVIRLQHPAVAESFRQLWRIMDKHLRADPVYATLPRKARRNV